MKCIILCAGYNLDNNDIVEPKALMKLASGEILLDLLIAKIDKLQTIDEIYVVTNGQNYDKFFKWSKGKKANIKIVNDNTTPDAKLGAIGDIKFTLNYEHIDDDLMIIAGDAIYDFDFKPIYDYYCENKSALVAVKQVENLLDLKKYGVVRFDEDNKIIEMHEKSKMPIGNHIALALYFYPKQTIRMFDFYLSEGNKTTAPGYFLEYLYKMTDVYVYKITGDYSDFN